MNYRPEIDGLRAVAVVSVILFHAGFAIFSGGYIGVDVFFIISGYLITTIILKEKIAGTFSIINFYERRARRILPALFFVILACLPFAWFWLSPNDMKDFSKSVRDVSIFLSNVLFYRQSGYFDTSAELKPLLHTWSLAVEEQYYLLFPLVILVLWAYARKLIPYALLLMAAVSLLYAQHMVETNPSAAFYLLPSRIWELMVGSFIAYLVVNGRLSLKGNQIASFIGLLLILYAIFFYNENTPYPSFYTLVPVTGAVLIILFSLPNTLVGRVLGSKPLVGVGLISYSAYLWHQPLFAFAKLRSIVDLTPFLAGLLVAITLLLAYLSWRFIETPFRQRNTISRTNLFKFSALGTVFFITFGLIGKSTEGYFYRDSFKDIDYKLRPNYGLDASCIGNSTLPKKCSTHDKPEILLWGDSFAMHLMEGLVASNPDIKVAQMTMNYCAPILDIAPIKDNINLTGCIKNNDKVFNWIKSQTSLKYVVLASLFDQYVKPEAKVALRDGTTGQGSDLTLIYFKKTLELMKANGIQPVIFSPTPQNGSNIGRCLTKANQFSNANPDQFSKAKKLCDFDLQLANKQQAAVIKLLKQIEPQYKVIWLSKGICVDGTCKASIGDSFIYRDYGHFTYEGSAKVGANMNFYKLITSE